MPRVADLISDGNQPHKETPMICISRSLLRSLGCPSDVLDRLSTDGADRGGLATSDLFSFGGGGNGRRDSAGLEFEPEPRTLILVGMADRYDEGRKRGATVSEMCINDSGLGFRTPTHAEALKIIGHLAACSHPDATAIAKLFEPR